MIAVFFPPAALLALISSMGARVSEMWLIGYIQTGGVLTDPQEAEGLVNLKGVSKEAGTGCTVKKNVLITSEK